MEKKFVRILWTITLIAGGTLAGVFFLRPERVPVPTVTIGDVVFEVTVADTAAERERGLSGTLALGPTQGKLFVFDAPGTPTFWMKEMRFSIDIIWIAEDGTVADLTRELSPASYPATVSPSVPIRYVLEVPAGTVDKRGITIGQTAVFQK